MASTYTVNIGIEKPGTGDQSGTWGVTTNTNFDIIDQATNGVATVTLAAAGTSGSPNTLQINNGALSDGRNRFIEFNDGADLGATAYVQLDPNDAEKIVHIRNSLSASRSLILFQGTYNASNDFEVPNGADVLVKFDGGGASATVTDVNVNLTPTKITTSNADINGGSVDGTTIGAASAAAGSFTTLQADTSLNVDGTATTDGLTVAGNVSVDGGTIKLDGNYPTGTQNVALGNTALDSVASGGSYNTAIGDAALTANTTGGNNTGVGALALTANVDGVQNTAVGGFALDATRQEITTQV